VTGYYCSELTVGKFFFLFSGRTGYGGAMADLDRYLLEQQERFEDELCELLRIPSISAGQTHQAEIRQAGEWVANQLSQMGCGRSCWKPAAIPWCMPSRRRFRRAHGVGLRPL